MLVLSRYLGQEIVIGDDIVIRVTRIDGDKVRLGIEAPREVLILRREVPRKAMPDFGASDGEGG